MEKEQITSLKDMDDYHRSVEAIVFANQIFDLYRIYPEKIYPDHEPLLFKHVAGTIELCLEKAEDCAVQLIRARYLLAACRLAFATCQNDRWDYLTTVCKRIQPKMEDYLESYDPFSKDNNPEIESVMMNIMSEYFHMLRHEILPTDAPRIKNELTMKAYTCGMLWLDDFGVNQWEDLSISVQLRRLRDLINYGGCRKIFMSHEIGRKILTVIEKRMEQSTEYNPEAASLYLNIINRMTN